VGSEPLLFEGLRAATTKSANWSSPRERDAVRALILTAARTLAERDGLEAVTLSAVAKETKIARPAIYSHFSSRRDLLAEMSAKAADASAKPSEPSPAGGGEEVSEAPGLVTDASEQASNAPSQDDPSQGGEPSSGDQSQGDYDELMRAQAEALQQLTKQVIVPKPRQRDAAESALSRMEARLTVTEQSLAALDQRFGERLKTVTAQTGSLSETLQGLRTRLEKFEQRQQSALAQLSLEVHYLTRQEQAQLVAPVETTAQAELLLEPENTVEAQPVETNDEEGEPAREQSYLHSARLAAINAAARSAAITPKRKSAVSRVKRVLFGKRRWTWLAIAAVVVAWFDFYVFANYQPAQGGIAPVTAQMAAAPTKLRPVLSPRAQLVRGLKYLNGDGVPTNIDKARRWLERAALRGQPVAQNLMGVLHQTGTGVPGDMAAAIRWYEASAQQGNLKAMTNLGKLYAGGWEDGTDYVKAVEWFAKAAASGEVDAQFDLAILYERGQGVSRSLVEA
jgi:AcrR family transcriptional regulator